MLLLCGFPVSTGGAALIPDKAFSPYCDELLSASEESSIPCNARSLGCKMFSKRCTIAVLTNNVFPSPGETSPLGDLVALLVNEGASLRNKEPSLY